MATASAPSECETTTKDPSVLIDPTDDDSKTETKPTATIISPVAKEQPNSSEPDARSPLQRSYSKPLSGTGLSELSKQLRVLQAKNEAQRTEIDRLERKLKILAELQNVSVAAITEALRAACQAEAHFELQNRVAFLTAQLEAAELAKQSTRAGLNSAGVDSQELANLQLRIGELEEVEESSRSEIEGLYKKLSEQTAKATRLEGTCAQQKSEIEALKLTAAVSHIRAAGSEPEQVVSNTPVVPEAERVAEEKNIQELVEHQVEHEKVALLESQLSAAEKQHKLRQAQFKARFTVQEENIHDLKQQVNSLYLAFELLREEREEDVKMTESLKSFLTEADSQVAFQTAKIDKRTTSPAAPTKQVLVQNTPPQSPAPMPPRTPFSSPDLPPKSHRRMSGSLGKESVGSSTSFKSINGEPVMAGTLLLRTPGGVIKRWKRRNAALYVKFTHHELVFSGDGGNHEFSLALTAGVAAVHPYVNHEYAFSVHVNGFDVRESQSVYAAAESEEEYRHWMLALEMATKGIQKTDGDVAPPREISAEEQEARDLERALELSETDR